MQHELNHFDQPIGALLTDWQPPAYPHRQVLQGRYCRLEPLDVAHHAQDLYEANALEPQGRCWTYLPYGPFASLDAYRAWMQESCSGNDPMFFAIIKLADEKAAGVVSYSRITPAAGSIEVGHINYSPKLIRSAAATEAMYLLMKNAFELGYRRYEWKCNVLNQPSRAAAQRLGLSYEGVFRQATVVKQRSRDTAWYAAIDGEWPALERAFVQWLSVDNFDAQGQQKIALATLTAPILKQRG